MATVKVSMKLVIDKKNQKVLFAEAGKDCVDFLFHLLQLPTARVVKYLTKEAMVGSLGTLYEGLGKLDNNYIQTSLTKDLLLAPKPASGVSTPVPLSTIKEAATPKYLFYKCPRHVYKSCWEYVSDNPAATCQTCSSKMTTVVKYVAPPGAGTDEGGYVKGLFTYIVMDDLGVEPSSSVTGIELLSKLNVKDIGILERRVVTFDASQGLALLKASFTSKTVLTDVFLRRIVARV